VGQTNRGAHSRGGKSSCTLTLLAAASEGEPVLCLVDDAQWLDPGSAEALQFATRRIEADRIVMLFAARSAERVSDAVKDTKARDEVKRLTQLAQA
jgi:predicted ATPase